MVLIVTAAAAEQRSSGVPKSRALPGPATWEGEGLGSGDPSSTLTSQPQPLALTRAGDLLTTKYYLLGKAEDDLLQSERERTGERVPKRLVRVRARFGVGDGLGLGKGSGLGLGLELEGWGWR